jgi:hypothetical protein
MWCSRLGIAVSFLVASGALGPAAAWAQASATFGTTSSTVHVIGAPEFDVSLDTATWFVGVLGGVGHVIKRSSAPLVAFVRLPAGAVVTSVELQGCDNNSAEGIEFTFARFSSSSDPGTLISSGATGDLLTPGCGLFPGSPFNPLVIDNNTNTYGVGTIVPMPR